MKLTDLEEEMTAQTQKGTKTKEVPAPKESEKKPFLNIIFQLKEEFLNKTSPEKDSAEKISEKNELKKLRAENAKYKEYVLKLVKEFKIYNQKHNQKIIDIASDLKKTSENQLREVNTELADKNNKLKKLFNHYKTLKEQEKESTEKIEIIEKKNLALKSELKVLEADNIKVLEEKETFTAKLKSNLEIRDEEIKRLKKENESLAKIKKVENDNLESDKNKITKMSEDFKDLSKKHLAATTEIKSLKRFLSLTKENQKKLDLKLGEEQTQVKKMTEKNAELFKLNEQRIKEKSVLDTSFKKLEIEKKKFEESFKEKSKEVESLNKELSSLKVLQNKELMALEQEVEIAKSDLKVSLEKNAAFEKENLSLKTDLDTLRKKEKEHQKTLKNYEAVQKEYKDQTVDLLKKVEDVKTLNVKVSKLESNNQSLTLDNESYARQIQEKNSFYKEQAAFYENYKNEKIDLDNKIKDLTKKTLSLSKEIETKSAQITKLSDHNESLFEQNQELSVKAYELEKVHLQSEETIKNLKSQIDQLESDLSSYMESDAESSKKLESVELELVKLQKDSKRVQGLETKILDKEEKILRYQKWLENQKKGFRKKVVEFSHELRASSQFNPLHSYLEVIDSELLKVQSVLNSVGLGSKYDLMAQKAEELKKQKEKIKASIQKIDVKAAEKAKEIKALLNSSEILPEPPMPPSKVNSGKGA